MERLRGVLLWLYIKDEDYVEMAHKRMPFTSFFQAFYENTRVF